MNEQYFAKFEPLTPEVYSEGLQALLNLCPEPNADNMADYQGLTAEDAIEIDVDPLSRKELLGDETDENNNENCKPRVPDFDVTPLSQRRPQEVPFRGDPPIEC